MVAVLLYAAAMLVGGKPPAPDEPILNVVRYLAEHRTALLWQALLLAPVGPLALWFFATLRGVLVAAEARSAALTNAGFAAAILLFASVTGGSLLLTAVVWRGAEATAPELVRFAYDCAVLALYALSSMLSVASVVAPTIVGWRMRILPGASVVVASALAVANVLELFGLFSVSAPFAAGAAAGWIAIPAYFAWIAGASWALLRRSAPAH
jgi:hypothetical protein